MSKKKSQGWGSIIFWIIIFWPIGLYKLFKKLGNKSDLMNITNGPTIAAWTLIIFGSLALIGSLGSLFEDFGVTLFIIGMVVGGVLILKKVNKTKAKAEQYKKYLNVIVNAGERDIDNISSALSVTYGQAQSDIKAMIDEGFLEGAYIHEGEHRVVLRHDVHNYMDNTTAYASTSNKSRSERCPGCGANNVVIEGKITECEYCGTALNG